VVRKKDDSQYRLASLPSMIRPAHSRLTVCNSYQFQSSGESLHLSLPREHVRISLDDDASFEAVCLYRYTRWYLEDLEPSLALKGLSLAWNQEVIGAQYVFQSESIGSKLFPSGKRFQFEVIKGNSQSEVKSFCITRPD
jgi:hypothetical protein